MNTDDEIGYIEIEVLKGKEDSLKQLLKGLQNSGTRKLILENEKYTFNLFSKLISHLPVRDDFSLVELYKNYDHKGRPEAIIGYAKQKKIEVKDWEILYKQIDRFFRYFIMVERPIEKASHKKSKGKKSKYRKSNYNNSIIKTFYLTIEHLFGDSMKAQTRKEFVGYICYQYGLIEFKKNENPSDPELEDRVKYALSKESKSEVLDLDNKLLKIIEDLTK
jgi:hypothetical protein